MTTQQNDQKPVSTWTPENGYGDNKGGWAGQIRVWRGHNPEWRTITGEYPESPQGHKDCFAYIERYTQQNDTYQGMQIGEIRVVRWADRNNA